MAIIDIQITFDAATIAALPGPSQDPNNPSGVSTSLIYMVTQADEALSGEGGGELNVSAETDDIIRWRVASLSPDYSTLLYAFGSQGANLITQPQSLETSITIPVPNPTDPQQPGRATVPDYFWQCTVLQPGEVTYHFSFMVVDRDGTIVGYYDWDPFITITS